MKVFIIFSIFLLSLVINAVAQDLPKEVLQVVKNDKLTIYQFTGNVGASYVIESKNGIVLIDAQFAKQEALNFEEFFTSLKKPVLKFYITHQHAGHALGLSHMKKQYSTYSSAKTIEDMKVNGVDDTKVMLGLFNLDEKENMPKKIIIPNNVIKEGDEIIDGITYNITIFNNAHTTSDLIIAIKEASALALGDLLYPRIRAGIALSSGSLQGWSDSLSFIIKNYGNYSYFLGGHNVGNSIAQIKVFQGFIEYAAKSYNNAKTTREFKDLLLSKYPTDYVLPSGLDWLWSIYFIEKARLKRGELNQKSYDELIKKEAIAWDKIKPNKKAT